MDNNKKTKGLPISIFLTESHLQNPFTMEGNRHTFSGLGHKYLGRGIIQPITPTKVFTAMWLSCIIFILKNHYTWTREAFQERKLSDENVTVAYVIILSRFSICCQGLEEFIFFLPSFSLGAVLSLLYEPCSLSCGCGAGHLQVYLLLCKGQMVLESSGLPSCVSPGFLPFYSILPSPLPLFLLV